MADSDDEEENNKLIEYDGGEAHKFKDEDHGDQQYPSQPRYCCCCSDTVCIWIGWIIFVIILGIFIFAMVFKYRKDGDNNQELTGNSENPDNPQQD